MNRIILFLFGFGLTVIGFTFIITYLNLTTMGYTILDYLKFIIRRVECVLGIIGIILINISLYKKEKVK
ncbi:MAG: hypothetical protein IJN90_06000 [Bacilli bacterium]|nr:hypothetical protein [Bacilli bacterium]